MVKYRYDVWGTCGLIAGAIIGGTIGGVTAYNMAQEIGITGWELAGYTVFGVFGGSVLGGMIGAGIGAGIGGLISGAMALLGSISGGLVLNRALAQRQQLLLRTCQGRNRYRHRGAERKQYRALQI